MEQIKDNVYRLEEVKDDMKKTISHIKSLIAEQTELCDLVKNSDKKEKFESFTKDLDNAINNYNSQIDTLSKKVELLEELLSNCKNADTKYNINLFIMIFEIFKN